MSDHIPCRIDSQSATADISRRQRHLQEVTAWRPHEWERRCLPVQIADDLAGVVDARCTAKSILTNCASAQITPDRWGRDLSYLVTMIPYDCLIICVSRPCHPHNLAYVVKRPCRSSI